MTTEIAVLSRNGVALATDSAITISGVGPTKIFDSADKLFELHCLHPIAMMVNGSMDLFGVPWDLIIKDFRKAEEDNPNRSLENWSTDFLKFVEGRADIQSGSAKYMKTIALTEMQILQAEVYRRCWNTPEIFTQDPRLKVPPIINDYIIDRTKNIESIDVCETLKGVNLNDVLDEHKKYIQDIISREFDPIVLPTETTESIAAMIVRAAMASIPSPHSTGLIIAGYGSGQDYPGVISIEIDGCVKGKLKVVAPEKRTEITDPDFGYAFAFAQNDVIERLLNGVDPRFVQQISNFIEDAADQLSSTLTDDLLPRSSRNKKSAATENIKAFIREIGRNLIEDIVPSFSAQFREDFERMMAMMPKPELIELAEALVSITAIERKASSDQRSVGGPIDVAFITKHEGFVWIKRKYYFEERLNPRYFWRKYRTEKSGAKL